MRPSGPRGGAARKACEFKIYTLRMEIEIQGMKTSSKVITLADTTELLSKKKNAHRRQIITTR